MIEGSDPVAALDTSAISELLAEVEQRIISEIHQNRSIQTSVLAALQDQKILKKAKIKSAAIEQIVESWLYDLDKLSNYQYIEDLEQSIKFDHLREFALDSVRELQSRNYVTVEPSGRLRWNL